jgi:peptide/nickel transport system substrate-binding protein
MVGFHKLVEAPRPLKIMAQRGNAFVPVKHCILVSLLGPPTSKEPPRMTLTALRRGSLALLSAGLCAGLAACGSSGSSSSSSSSASSTSAGTSSSSAAATSGSSKAGKIVLADSSAPNSLDPDGPASSVKQNLIAVNNTYDNLVTYVSKPNPTSLGGGDTIDASGPVAPALATSWKVTAHTAVFNLRKGVKSQYGNTLTSADVVWSYNRAVADKATGAFIYSVDGNITGVKALGKYKVEYTLKSTAPLLMYALTSHYSTIYDATEVKKHVTAKDPQAKTWLSSHTAGFGAYDVSSYTSGQSVDFVPNKNYYRGAPKISVDFISIPSDSNRFASLQKGSVNIALDLTPEENAQVKSDSSLHVYAIKGNSQTTMFPNFDVPQLKNPLVRQALQYATPQDQIVSQIYKGFGFPLQSVATAGTQGYTTQYWHYTYDIAKAKALMKQAGYASGFSTKLYYPSDDSTLTSLAPILQSSYQQIGIKVTLVPESSSTLITQAFGSKNLPMYLTDQASSVLPSIANIAALYQTGGFANINNYSVPAFDAAAKTTLSTTDSAKVIAAAHAMQKVTAQDPVYVSVAGLEDVAATSSDIGGYWQLPDMTPQFRTLTVN